MAYEVEDYFQILRQLKKKYSGKIKILSAMEVDYISEHEDNVNQLARNYQGQLDDLIILALFIKGRSGYS